MEIAGQTLTKPCLIYDGLHDKKGYGLTYLNGKKGRAHKESYKENVGPVENGLYVLHHCDVRDCIEPTHLYLGNQDQNMKDMVRRNRSNHPIGNRNGRAILSETDVKHIRRSVFKTTTLAKYYGVSWQCISSIRNFKTWKHINLN